jgi:hypothetical protein
VAGLDRRGHEVSLKYFNIAGRSIQRRPFFYEFSFQTRADVAMIAKNSGWLFGVLHEKFNG